jgi:spermidine/putrescine transport system ATP-binding protein
MEYVLDVKNLQKHFADHTAVNGIDFFVEEGKFFSILGPSGCGKTTLLRMIAGFLEPTSGSIKIREKEMIGIEPNKRPVNLVFQNLALFPRMNVEENIAFGLKRKKLSKNEIDKKVKDILEKVHLKGYGKKEVSQLSGGQKQRIAIARSLVLEPSILLLDEPLGALDLKLRETMKIELKKLQAEFGTTFIYITHDQSEALVMSDKVAVMNNGQFEQIDTPKNLYSNPKTSFVAGFVGESNIFNAKLDKNDEVISEEGLTFKVNLIEKIKNKCKVYIRPESIILMPDEKLEGLNIFNLTVKTILFDGSNTKLLTSIEKTDHEIMVSLPQNRQFAHIKDGDVIRAGVHFNDCKCYKK